MTRGQLLVGLMAFAAWAVCGVRADDSCPVNPNVRGHEDIEWSIGYAFNLTNAKKGLPRVLLVGDSICNGYQEAVQRRLNGKVNVSYWVSSYCLTMPAHRKLLDLYLSEASYDVIHFNNGLHSLDTDPPSWQKSFRETLAFIRARQPKAKIVWCTSTPLKDPKLTAKARRLNELAAQVVAEFGGIAVNDLFARLDPLDREKNWSDVFHHHTPLREKEADWVAASVLKTLGR